MSDYWYTVLVAGIAGAAISGLFFSALVFFGGVCT